jgi:20S proteasome alpha/beta subunit
MSMLLPSSFGIAVLAWLLCTVTSSSYNAYNYDLTTPMFTPDGRLLQVEYACRAASHSSPLVVLKRDDDDTVIIMVTKSSNRGQDRLVVFGESVICMSGVLSDSLTLLRKVQQESENRLRAYGTTTLSSLQIATILGDACQLHAFGMGMRPYGSTMIVCGSSSSVVVWQTDPSGAVKRIDDTVVVVGGTDAMQAKLRKDVSGNDSKDLPETLRTMAKVLLENVGNNDKDESKRRNEWLEVAVLSPLHGVHCLTDTQVQSLIQASTGGKVQAME